MPRSRTQKQVAKRIDLSYHKRLHPLRFVRRMLIVLCTLATIGWIGFSAVRMRGGKLVLIDRIDNPGHVSRAHASFENNCQACHTGDGKGKFTLTVTDSACLKCHDGSLHDANQKIAADHSGVSRAAMTLAVADAQHPAGAHSAGCVNCHIEHRGDSVMLGGSDANCTVCHANLSPATRDGHPVVQNVVTAFTSADHPHFGRSLTVDGKWVDPTKIKFNHKFHFEQVQGLREAANNCSLCHTTQSPPAKIGTDLPPFANGKARPIEDARGEEGGQMLPVNYAQHCSGCHKLEVSNGVTVAHVDLAIVRSQLADLTPFFHAKLAAMSQADRDKELTESPAGSGSGARRRGGSASAAKKTISEDDWIKKQLDKVKSETGDWLDQPAASKLPQLKALAALNADATKPEPAILEAYVAFGASNACSKCHEMNGGGVQIASPTTAPTSAPAAQPVALLATLPTGIPDTSRRWFVNSRFDHRPHRDIRCIDCHAAALTSGADTATATADILSPDLDRFAATNFNCVNCHKPGGASVGATEATCITCHVFHDRSKERPAGSIVAEAGHP